MHIDEKIDITYSYWDGSGHRKVVTVKYSIHLLLYNLINKKRYNIVQKGRYNPTIFGIMPIAIPSIKGREYR